MSFASGFGSPSQNGQFLPSGRTFQDGPPNRRILEQASESRTHTFQDFEGKRVSLRLVGGKVKEDVIVDRGTETQILSEGVWFSVPSDFTHAWLPRD